MCVKYIGPTKETKHVSISQKSYQIPQRHLRVLLGSLADWEALLIDHLIDSPTKVTKNVGEVMEIQTSKGWEGA